MVRCTGGSCDTDCSEQQQEPQQEPQQQQQQQAPDDDIVDDVLGQKFSCQCNVACKSDNELGTTTGFSREVMAAACDADDSCVSFEIRESTQAGGWSTSCTHELATELVGWTTYFKKGVDGNDFAQVPCDDDT